MEKNLSHLWSLFVSLPPTDIWMINTKDVILDNLWPDQTRYWLCSLYYLMNLGKVVSNLYRLKQVWDIKANRV